MILAIDLGSTNFKAALFDDTLNRAGEFSLPAPYITNDGNCAEMDVDAVRQSVVELIENTCRSAGHGTDSIVSLAVTSQAQNFTILNEQGSARCPVISWLDKRSGKEARDLWKTLGKDWHKHCSFSELSECMQLAHILWVKRNMPEVLSGKFSFVTLPGLVFEMIAGINLTDDNLAVMGGAYSLLNHDWRSDVLNQCGLKVSNMPQCVPVGRSVIAQSNCATLNLKKEISLVSAGNDQTAGAFGNGCKGSDILVTLGTALVVYRRTGDQSGPYSKSGCWGPYPGGGYYELAFNNNGCQALDWARDLLMPSESVEQFDAAVARAVPMVTEATGTFRPACIRTSKAWQGKFANVDEKAYAILEGIAFDLYRLVFDDLAAPAGSSLRVIGGGSRSEIWLQLIADILNCTVSVGSGDSLLGAAAMAAGCEVTAVQNKMFYPDPDRQQLLNSRRIQWCVV